MKSQVGRSEGTCAAAGKSKAVSEPFASFPGLVSIYFFPPIVFGKGIAGSQPTAISSSSSGAVAAAQKPVICGGQTDFYRQIEGIVAMDVVLTILQSSGGFVTYTGV